jgi:hypothetical protein
LGQLVPASGSIKAATLNQREVAFSVRHSLFLILFVLITAAPAAAQVKPNPSPTPKSEDQMSFEYLLKEIRLPVAAKDSFGHYDPTLNITCRREEASPNKSEDPTPPLISGCARPGQSTWFER